MAPRFAGIPVTDEAAAQPAASPRFGGAPRFKGVPVENQLSENSGQLPRFGGTPVESNAADQLQTEGKPAQSAAQPRFPGSPTERDEAKQPVAFNPMAQGAGAPTPDPAAKPTESPFEPHADDVISATGKAIKNAVPHWQQQLGALTQAVGEKFGEIVNAPAPDGVTDTRDPTLQRQAGEIAAKISLRGQLDRIAAGEKVTPIDVAPGSLEYYVSSIAGSTLEMAPGMAASLLLKNPLPAMAIMGAQSGANAYAQARDMGLEPDKARQFAGLYAIAEGIPEALPIHMLLGHESGKLLGSIVKGAVGEGASEMFTEGLQALIDKGFIKPDETWGDVWPRIRDAGIIGAGSGGLIGAAAPGLETASSAVLQATNAARQVSAEVLGKGIQTLRTGGSGLSPEFLASMKGKSLDERIAAIKQRQAEIGGNPETEAGSTISTPPEASMTPAAVIKHFEGFITSPRWDVNAYRAGYGSDTWTDAEGKVHKVEPGDKITKEDAERDIQRRLDTEFIPSAKAEVGAQAWNALPAAAQAAVASITYNYGNLPNDIARAVRSGDTEAIAAAIEDHISDNGGINARRREQEAALVRGQAVDLKAGSAVTGSPRKRLTAYLDLADRTLTKLTGATTEEGLSRTFLKLQPTDAAGKPQTSPYVNRLGDRIQRADFQGTDERANLKFILGQIREISTQLGDSMPANKVAAVTKRLEDTIKEIGNVHPMPGPEGGRAEPVLQQMPFAGEEQAAPPPPRRDASRETIVATPTGNMRISVRPEIVDLRTLKAASGELQPRDRSKLASNAQIEKIAAELDPEQLLDNPSTDRGAPIVGPDDIVESGNGRIAAIKRAFEAHPDKYEAYVGRLKAEGYDVAAGGEMPVLVRRRVSDLNDEQRVHLVEHSNRDNKLAMSPAEVARLDAKGMDSGTLQAFKGGSPADPQNADFVTRFSKNLTTEEAGQLIDGKGNLNAAGVTRLRSAVFAAAYDDASLERFAESTDDNVKAITGAMGDVAGEWAVMRREIGSGEVQAIDPTPHLLEAVQLISTARDTAEKQGTRINAEIQRALDQLDLLSGETVGAETRAYVEGFYNDGTFRKAEGRDNIATWLRNVISATKASAATMFGPAEDATVEEIARNAKPKREGKTGDLLASRGSAEGRRGDRQADAEPEILSRGRAPETGSGEVTADALDSNTLNLTFNPGPKWIPDLGQAMPARQQSVTVSNGQLEIPEKPTIRDEPRKKLLAVIGERLYQGKVKGKSRAGFYRRSNSEIRVRHFDDIEVQAHEAAHFLEFHHKFASRFRTLRQAYRAELDPLSYTQDPKVIGEEGFAEYVRLWATQYAKAKQAAPRFTAAFEAELKKADLWKKMTAFQEAAHRWYYQGALAQFRGKSGESEEFADQLGAFMRQHPVARFLQGFIDPAFGAKLIERQIYGRIHSAERSAYKLMRLTRGAESMHEAAIEDGALTLEPDGSYGTVGKGLKEIFFPAAKHGAERFDQLMEYFKARRGDELQRQGRENLFTSTEIKAGLALAQQHPEFKTIFEDWLAFNDQMLTFYTDMGLITSEQAAGIRDGNKAYVPFFRVRHQIDQEASVRGTGKQIGKRLTGGERNTGEILENIVSGLHANIQAALTARARARLFSDIQGSQEGSEFAVEIPPDSKRIKVAEEQLTNRIAEVLISLGQDVRFPSGLVVGPGTNPNPVDMSNLGALIASHPELAAFWQHGMLPETDETGVESVILGDRLRHFEVNSRLLMELLTAPRAAPNLIRVLRVPKRVLTQAITGTIQFMFPNIVRDTMAAGALSQSGSRPFIESARGLKAYISNDPRFKAFRANGGLFSGRITSTLEGNKPKALAGVRPEGWDRVGQVLAGYRTVVSSTEQGTRVGEFIRATEKGENPLEAAFRGRMISGDFAQMGRNEVWSWILQVTPFANAGLRGTETLLQNMFEANGKVRLNGPSALKFAKMTLTRFGLAMTVATVLLWALNHDDERYKRLTVDEKSRFWHIWLPTGQHITIPKPYGAGFIFADLPEMALDYMADKDGPQLAKQLAFSTAQHFWFMDFPGFIQPWIEQISNRKFTGAPVVPPNLADLTGDDLQYQYTDTTPQIYRLLGKATAGNLDISPLVAEHYTKGFLGYLEAYMVDATDALFWNEKAWGPRPFANNVLGYFAHQFDGTKPPYRTKWTEGYYDLRARAMSKAQAYGTLFKMAGHDSSPLTTFTQSEVNLSLRALASRFRKVDKSMQGGAAYLDGVKYDPSLSKAEKEQKINDYYEQRDKVLGTTYREISAIVAKLEAGIK